MMDRGHALSRDELIRVLTAYTGIATTDGAVGGGTLIDANLINNPLVVPAAIPEKTILILTGTSAGEDKGAASFNNVNGTITLQGTGFNTQILAGTVYRILNISSVEIDVNIINTKIGTNVDAAGTTTLFAWLAKLFIEGGQGLVYYGVVTAVPGANQFTIPTLAGMGAGKFADATAPYRAFVLRDAGGLGAVPQGEMQNITAYVTATGVFTTNAFTAAVAVDDEILLLHPRIAEIATILADMNVPAIDAVANALIRDVVGNKADIAAAGIIKATNSILALAKQSAKQSLFLLADVTTFTNANNFASLDLVGYEDDFFLNWYVFVVRDDGGAGAAPQGEYRPVTDYVSATGGVVHNAFSANLAVGDQVMIIHPMLYEILTIRGGAETLESLDDELDAMLDLAGGDALTLLMTGAEQVLYEETDVVPFFFAGLKIDWTGLNFGALEDTSIRFYEMVDGTNLRLISTEVFLAAALPVPVVTYHPRNAVTDIQPTPGYYRQGVRITAQQGAIGGGWNTLTYCRIDAKRGT